MKKPLIRIGIGLFAFVVVVFSLAAYFLGSIVKHRIEVVGPRMAQASVTLDGASVWLLPGSAELRKLSIGNPAGWKAKTAINLGDISVSLNPMTVFAGKTIIDKITIKSPEITVEGGLKKNNLTQIEKNVNAYVRSHSDAAQPETKPASPPPSNEAPKPAKKLQVNEIAITGARVRFVNLFATGANVSISLPDIHLANLGSGPEGITSAGVAEATLTALLNSIATDGVDAVAKLAPQSVSKLNKAAEKLKKLLGQ